MTQPSSTPKNASHLVISQFLTSNPSRTSLPIDALPVVNSRCHFPLSNSNVHPSSLLLSLCLGFPYRWSLRPPEPRQPGRCHAGNPFNWRILMRVWRRRRDFRSWNQPRYRRWSRGVRTRRTVRSVWRRLGRWRRRWRRSWRRSGGGRRGSGWRGRGRRDCWERGIGCWRWRWGSGRGEGRSRGGWDWSSRG